jgi:hypothetical protein
MAQTTDLYPILKAYANKNNSPYIDIDLFLNFLEKYAVRKAQEHPEWATGIPGFGNNVFSVLWGEYRVETIQGPGSAAQSEAAAASGGDDFSVRVSGENLLFDPNLWQPRPGTGISGILQRQDGQAILISFPFSGGNNLGAWTIIFHFPRGLAATGLDDLSINRFINAWYGRFRYFLSLVKTSSDISLPAVIRF